MFRFIVVLLLLVIFVLLFQTRSIKVKGNEYYGENSIISWLEKDKLSVNTVYLFWKYNYTDAEVPSVVEEMKLTFENPWTLVAHVKEKGKSGYVSSNDTNLYFDRKGTALFESIGDKGMRRFMQRDGKQQGNRPDNGSFQNIIHFKHPQNTTTGKTGRTSTF